RPRDLGIGGPRCRAMKEASPASSPIGSSSLPFLDGRPLPFGFSVGCGASLDLGLGLAVLASLVLPAGSFCGFGGAGAAFGAGGAFVRGRFACLGSSSSSSPCCASPVSPSPPAEPLSDLRFLPCGGCWASGFGRLGPGG